MTNANIEHQMNQATSQANNNGTEWKCINIENDRINSQQ